MHKAKKGRKGFTLMEVLLVIVILGMLATIGIVQLLPTREGAKVDITRTLIDRIAAAMDTYSLHVGHYPTEAEGGINALLVCPQFENEKLTEKWRGPYLKKEPTDAWDNALNYEPVPTEERQNLNVPVKIWSNGPDGQSGTDDDIRNWTEEPMV